MTTYEDSDGDEVITITDTDSGEITYALVVESDSESSSEEVTVFDSTGTAY